MPKLATNERIFKNCTKEEQNKLKTVPLLTRRHQELGFHLAPFRNRAQIVMAN